MWPLTAFRGSHRPRCILPAAKWSEPFFVQARPTSAADVVKAWKLNDKGEKVKVDGAIGAKQIFVEDLAAITANLGLITDGGLRGSKYNYWAVNDTRLKDGAYLYRGAFRVGGTKQSTSSMVSNWSASSKSHRQRNFEHRISRYPIRKRTFPNRFNVLKFADSRSARKAYRRVQYQFCGQ